MENQIAQGTGASKCDRPATRLEDLRGRLDSCIANFRRLNERCLDVISRAEGSPAALDDRKDAPHPDGLMDRLTYQINDLDQLNNELSDRIAYFESTI